MTDKCGLCGSLWVYAGLRGSLQVVSVGLHRWFDGRGQGK